MSFSHLMARATQNYLFSTATLKFRLPKTLAHREVNNVPTLRWAKVARICPLQEVDLCCGRKG